MAWYDGLLNQGFVPAGATPKAVVEPGQEPGYYPTDPLSTAVREFKKIEAEQKAEETLALKKMKDQDEMYKTLREQGYEPKRAWEAVNKLKFPDEPGGETKQDLEMKKIKAETEVIPIKNAPKLQAQIIQKIADGDPLTNGEQKIYDQTIKRVGLREDYLSGSEKDTHISTRERILKKVADGEPLTQGELELYNNVYVKGSDQINKITNKTEETNKAQDVDPKDLVDVYKPDGTPTRVHKDDLTKALLKGYKRR